MPIKSPPIPEGYSIAERMPPEQVERFAQIVESAPFVRKVLDSMPELVVVMTPTRQVVAANQAMLGFLELQSGAFMPGPRPGELLFCVHSHVSPDGCGNSKYCSQCGAFNTIMNSIARGERASGECLLTHERGGNIESLELYLWCAPFEVEDQPFSILAGIDISDQKRREALERTFLHDINNSIAVIRGRMELIDRDFHGVLDHHLEPIMKSTESLIEEVNSHRDLLLAENGDLQVHRREIESDRIIDPVLDSYGERKLGGGSLVKDPGSANVKLSTDPVLLRRVLGNMVKNALEASPTGGVVTMGCRERDGQVEFWVHNQEFIPEPFQMQLFQRSFSTKGYGRGLGTYSMRLLSERYLKGSISFESHPEHGTTFFARFPLGADHAS